MSDREGKLFADDQAVIERIMQGMSDEERKLFSDDPAMIGRIMQGISNGISESIESAKTAHLSEIMGQIVE